MNIALYGTGRAAGALGIAFTRAGHVIVGVDGRSPDGVASLASLFDVRAGIPDICVIAVSDDAITHVAQQLAIAGDAVPTVHVSGAVPASALGAIHEAGCQVGSFHPLQTMPDPERGADQLTGSWIGITADEPLRSDLVELAVSIGCHPFPITDEAKPLYHAAAAAAANFTLAVLSVSNDLFASADVPFASAQPLVEAIVENAFALGPEEALTGPIARGDVETVSAHLDAVRSAVGDRLDDFVALSALTARTAGTDSEFREILG